MRHIYVMGNTRYLFRYKIGISNNVVNRRDCIDKSLGGSVYVIFSIKLHYAYFLEQTLHGIYYPLNARMKGSGKTEWFWFIFPFSPILLILTAWIIQETFLIGLIMLFIYFLSK